jgi:hypothetical protein
MEHTGHLSTVFGELAMKVATGNAVRFMTARRRLQRAG